MYAKNVSIAARKWLNDSFNPNSIQESLKEEEEEEGKQMHKIENGKYAKNTSSNGMIIEPPFHECILWI